MKGAVGSATSLAGAVIGGAFAFAVGRRLALLASVVVLIGTLAGLAAGVVADAFGYLFTFVLGTTLATAGCVAVIAWLDRRPSARLAEVWR